MEFEKAAFAWDWSAGEHWRVVLPVVWPAVMWALMVLRGTGMLCLGAVWCQGVGVSADGGTLSGEIRIAPCMFLSQKTSQLMAELDWGVGSL